MNSGVAAADRRQAVRQAARAWRRAGAIDEAALAEIESRFPDDRVRYGPVLRRLLFLFTAVAIVAALSLFATIVMPRDAPGGWALLSAVAGLALAGATDRMQVAGRRRQGGIEAATSLLALLGLGAAALWLLAGHGDVPLHRVLLYAFLLAAILCAAAAWRWGFPLYAGVAAAALLVAAAGLPLGRALWIVLPLAAAPFLVRGTTSPRLPPAHRESCAAILLVALAALYLAVHVTSCLESWIEQLGDRSDRALAQAVAGQPLLFWSAALATAAVPAALLWLGALRRHNLLLLAGTVTAVASLVTLRTYLHFLPVWGALMLLGLLLLAVAMGLRRYLESGPAGERRGFTAAPLFGAAAHPHLLESGAAALAFTPAPAAPDAGPAPFAGQGGRSGGAGASGEF